MIWEVITLTELVILLLAVAIGIGLIWALLES